MRRKALKQKKKWNPALFGIRNAGIRNPVVGIRNPQHEIQNPRLSWIPLHGAQRGSLLSEHYEYNRKEKSLPHVAIVAKFLGDNKAKTSLKKWIRPVSDFIDLIYFHLIVKSWQNCLKRSISQELWKHRWNSENFILKMSFCEILTFIFSGSYKKFSLVLLQITNYIYNP